MDTNDNGAASPSKTTPEQLAFIREQDALRKENGKLTTKMSLAHAFMSMWIKAYDALLHHGVNVRSLPEYNDYASLDRGLEVGLEHGGAPRVMDYIKRVENAIKAAVRRKGFREV